MNESTTQLVDQQKNIVLYCNHLLSQDILLYKYQNILFWASQT